MHGQTTRMALIRRIGWLAKSSKPFNRFAPLSSEFQPVQAQCVADHGNRAEGHGDAGDHRTQEYTEKRIEHSRCDWNSHYVVDERKEQILPGEADELLKRRFAIIQVWRAINPIRWRLPMPEA